MTSQYSELCLHPPSASQNGEVLGKETSLEDLWHRGMAAYRNSDWKTVVSNLEEAIPLFNSYQNTTLLCLQQCSETGEGGGGGGREGREDGEGGGRMGREEGGWGREEGGGGREGREDGGGKMGEGGHTSL